MVTPNPSPGHWNGSNEWAWQILLGRSPEPLGTQKKTTVQRFCGLQDRLSGCFSSENHIFFYPRERKELSYWWEHRNFMEYLEFWRFFLNRPCTIRYILYSTIRLEWGREWHGIFPFKVICPTAKKTTDRLHHLTFDWTIRSCTETGVYSQQRRLLPKEAHDI